MSFTDPQTITVNAVAVPLPRTSTDRNSGTFSSADGAYRLSVSHAYGKRNRRTVRIDSTKLSPDPLQPAINSRYSMSTYIVVDSPTAGYSNAELKFVVDALTAYLTATAGAKVTQLLGGEN